MDWACPTFVRSAAACGSQATVVNPSFRYALRIVEDWSDAPPCFDAAVYTSLTVVRKQGVKGSFLPQTASASSFTANDSPWPGGVTLIRCRSTRHPGRHGYSFPRNPVEPSLASPESRFGSPVLGMKCGCNDAFLVDHVNTCDNTSIVSSTRGNVRVDSEMLRPALRGESAARWRIEDNEQRILWTHDAAGP